MSPLGVVGIFPDGGGVFSALFGMTAVWGTLAGLNVLEISAFTAAIYFGGLVFQLPIGWLSDRMDRRKLVIVVAMIGTLTAALPVLLPMPFWLLVAVALMIGGISNPLYALLLAHTNDYLDSDMMAAASGGLLFVNGLGAIVGPLVIGRLMGVIGPDGFFPVHLGSDGPACALCAVARHAAPGAAGHRNRTVRAGFAGCVRRDGRRGLYRPCRAGSPGGW